MGVSAFGGTVVRTRMFIVACEAHLRSQCRGRCLWSHFVCVLPRQHRPRPVDYRKVIPRAGRLERWWTGKTNMADGHLSSAPAEQGVLGSMKNAYHAARCVRFAQPTAPENTEKTKKGNGRRSKTN